MRRMIEEALHGIRRDDDKYESDSVNAEILQQIPKKRDGVLQEREEKEMTDLYEDIVSS
jgi:hypothetical protein